MTVSVIQFKCICKINRRELKHDKETFGNVKDIVIVIKTKHNYPDFDY